MNKRHTAKHRFSPEAFKAHFPILQQAQNQQLLYLDSAATSQKPSSVIDALCHFYNNHNANAHRGSHRLGREATNILEDCRQLSANFLGAAEARSIVFCQGATDGLNLLASSIGQQLEPGDEIILSDIEHHANLVPWQMVAEQHKLQLRFLTTDQYGRPDVSKLPDILNERSKVLSISGASNTLGSLTELQKIRSLIGPELLFIIDAAQLVAHRPINVQTLDCDFLLCSGHKFYAPTGIGLLYGKPEKLNGLTPTRGGGGMIENVELLNSRYTDAPHRFETGSPNTAAIAGLRAAIEFIEQWSYEDIKLHEESLCTQLHLGLKALNIRCISQAEHNLGIASFTLDDADKNLELADYLDQQDIAIRAGHHCTQPLLKQRELSSVLRASVAPYNNQEDIARLLNTIAQWQKEEAALTETHSTQTHAAQKENEPEITGTELSSERAENVASARSWPQRQKLILRWGSDIEQKDELRQDVYQLKGCESALWLKAQELDGHWQFEHDSDSRLIRGLAALVLSWVNMSTSKDIQAVDFKQKLQALGLEKHLSQSRANGIAALTQRLQQLSK